MSAWPVLLNAALLALQVFLAVAYGGPVIAACLAFTLLMFLATFFMWAQQ